MASATVQCVNLSSGTMATLTGKTDFEILDKIQNELVLFSTLQEFSTWQEVWNEYKATL